MPPGALEYLIRIAFGLALGSVVASVFLAAFFQLAARTVLGRPVTYGRSYGTCLITCGIHLVDSFLLVLVVNAVQGGIDLDTVSRITLINAVLSLVVFVLVVNGRHDASIAQSVAIILLMWLIAVGVVAVFGGAIILSGVK